MSSLLHVLTVLALLSPCTSILCNGTFHYNLTLDFSWNKRTDDKFPETASDLTFESIICVTHNHKFPGLFRKGNMSSDGLQSALKGASRDIFIAYIEQNREKNFVYDYAQGKQEVNVEGNEFLQLYVNSTGNFTLISCFAGIYPSPGWFVGIDSKDLCGGDDGQINLNLTEPLTAWNSSLYKDVEYNPEDGAPIPIEPPGTVQPLEGFAPQYGILNAIMHRHLLEPGCESSKHYNITFDFNWNSLVDKMIPDDSINFVGFRNIVCVVHNDRFPGLWNSGNQSSPALRRVIMRKNLNPIKEYLNTTKYSDFILSIHTSEEVEAEGELTTEIHVDSRNNLTLLSCFASIEPSPGWFVGIDRQELCVEGEFLANFSSRLPGWDSLVFEADVYEPEGEVPEVSPPGKVRRLRGFAPSYGVLRGTTGDIEPQEENDSACFPAGEQVSVSSGVTISVEKLQIGDEILTVSGMSKIFMWSHWEPTGIYRFERLVWREGNTYASMRISGGHFVFVRVGSVSRMVKARDVKVGDRLIAGDGLDRVVAMKDSVYGKGLYNPHTLQGELLVGGIRVSAYTESIRPTAARALMAPIRGAFNAGWLETSRVGTRLVCSSSFRRVALSVAKWFFGQKD